MRLSHVALDILALATALAVSAVVAAAQVPAAKLGQVQDGRYENSYFEFTYTPASPLAFNTSEFIAGRNFPERTFVMFSAAEKNQAGQVRRSVTAYADRLTDYPEASRNAASYLSRVRQNQVHEGWEITQEQTHRQIADRDYFESDFKRGQNGEVVLVTVRKDYVLVFIFGAAYASELEGLVSSAQVKFAAEAAHAH